jgi:hypothetical protein
MRNRLIFSLIIVICFYGFLGASPALALAVHHSAISPQSPVGGGCYGQYANASPLYFQSCISINSSKQVAPDGYIQSTTSSNSKWGDCEVEVMMYVSSDGKSWLQDTSTPRQNCTSWLQNGQPYHAWGVNAPAQTIHEYYTIVRVQVVYNGTLSPEYTQTSPIQYCC